MPAPVRSLEERFWPKVDIREGDECWPWLGYVSPVGYGRVYVSPGHHDNAHRVSYALEHGDPGELHVLHSCDNKLCVNPAHLRAGTHRDNMLDVSLRKRTANARKTHCKRGHEFTLENTAPNGPIAAGGRGRSCRTCDNARRRVRRRLSIERQDGQFRCQSCPAGFTNERGLRTHRARRGH
jgi:hypothetical protein